MQGKVQLKAEAVLRAAGMKHPRRMVQLIHEAIVFLDLDLSGLNILTEAASGAYVVTPIIASLAGARKVTALTASSRFAKASEVLAQTRALETLCGAAPASIFTRRDPELFAAADIVTNLGFVRPIDSRAVAIMKPSAVVPLMCEAWEIRASDVDLSACRHKSIQVAGTNEDFPGLDVFGYSGWLALKLLFDAGIEICKSRIAIISSDKFGQVIRQRLEANQIQTRLISRATRGAVRGCDVIIVADYTREDLILGEGGDLGPRELALAAPQTTVVQFAGRVDVPALKEAGISVAPDTLLPCRRMARTLADLGPRPVIELHAAGLKVGELLWKRENRPTAISNRWSRLVQTI